MDLTTGLVLLALMAVFVVGMCTGAGASRDQSVPYLRRAQEAEAALREYLAYQQPSEPVAVAVAPQPAAPVVHVHLSQPALYPTWPQPPVIDAHVVPALEVGRQ